MCCFCKKSTSFFDIIPRACWPVIIKSIFQSQTCSVIGFGLLFLPKYFPTVASRWEVFFILCRNSALTLSDTHYNSLYLSAGKKKQGLWVGVFWRSTQVLVIAFLLSNVTSVRRFQCFACLLKTCHYWHNFLKVKDASNVFSQSRNYHICFQSANCCVLLNLNQQAEEI